MLCIYVYIYIHTYIYIYIYTHTHMLCFLKEVNLSFLSVIYMTKIVENFYRYNLRNINDFKTH